MREVLSYPSFRNLWIAQSLSSIGDALVIVVIALYVTDLTGSAADVGLVLAAYAAPFVLFLLVGGVLADRLPRAEVMMLTDLVRGVLHVLLAVLIGLHVAEIWHMALIGVLFGTAEAFFRPAATGLLPETIPEHLIQPAQAVTAAARESAIIVGPAVGTGLLFAFGAETAFALDAATFGLSILFLLRVRPRARATGHVRSTMLGELREGWTAVRQRAWVWATILAFSVTLLAGLAPLFTLGATIGAERYGEAAVFGLVQAIWGCGTLGGALLGLRWRPLRPMRAALIGTLLWPISLGAYALGVPIAGLVVIILAAGLGIGLFGVWWETALAERIPPHLLSRVSAYDWMGSLALLPIGYVIAGVLGDALGATETLAVGSLLSVAALAMALLPRETRQLRRLDAPVMVPTDPASPAVAPILPPAAPQSAVRTDQSSG